MTKGDLIKQLHLGINCLNKSFSLSICKIAWCLFKHRQQGLFFSIFVTQENGLISFYIESWRKLNPSRNRFTFLIAADMLTRMKNMALGRGYWKISPVKGLLEKLLFVDRPMFVLLGGTAISKICALLSADFIQANHFIANYLQLIATSFKLCIHLFWGARTMSTAQQSYWRAYFLLLGKYVIAFSKLIVK